MLIRIADLIGNQSRADNSSFPIQDGDGWFHITSQVYEESNRTWVQQEESRLHMIIIDSGEICGKPHENVTMMLTLLQETPTRHSA